MPLVPLPLLSTKKVVVIVLLPPKLFGRAIVPPPSMVNLIVGVVAPVATLIMPEPVAAVFVTCRTEPVPPLIVMPVVVELVLESTNVPAETVVAPE